MSTMRTHWFSAFELLASARDGKPAFDRVFGKPFFDYCAENPEIGAEFHGGMGSFSEAARRFVLQAYDFPDSGVLVDVGGGDGGLLLEALTSKPGLHGVLFDQDHVLAHHRLTELGADDRWELAAGSFFENVPPGGDLYVLQYIIHDWDDESCIRILRNCRRAMAPGGRVAIFDSVVPHDNDPHSSKTLDLVMLLLVTGKERTKAEFESLLAAADLRLERIVSTPGPLSVIEAVAQ